MQPPPPPLTHREYRLSRCHKGEKLVEGRGKRKSERGKEDKNNDRGKMESNGINIDAKGGGVAWAPDLYIGSCLLTKYGAVHVPPIQKTNQQFLIVQ
jgi:hypothetical protein